MISYFHVRQFCGIASAKADLTDAKVHLIKGPNASGKTSLADGLRYALLGEPGRVALKGQYKYLVKEGEKTGHCSVSLPPQGGAPAVKMTRIVPSGELVTDPVGLRVDLPPALPYVLDAQRLASMKPSDRRGFLREIMGVKVSKTLIAKRLAERECDADATTEIMPLLRSSTGFEDAEKYAKGKVAEARAGWKLLTGEVYGAKKAEAWTPQADIVDENALANLEQSVVNAEATMDELHDRLRAAKQAAEALPCPHCGAMVRYATLQNSTSHTLVPWDGGPGKAEDIEIIVGELQKATHNKNLMGDQVRELHRRKEANERAGQVEETARAQHTAAKQWGKLAEALGPDGVPAELLGEVLAPLNEHLRESSTATGWPQVQIMADMSIQAGGRWYPLLSESERWRADAMLAEAVSSFAGLGLLMLDRFDVLQPALRQPALQWFASLQERYSAILLFATMESETVGLKGPVHFHQLTAGRLQEDPK